MMQKCSECGSRFKVKDNNSLCKKCLKKRVPKYYCVIQTTQMFTQRFEKYKLSEIVKELEREYPLNPFWAHTTVYYCGKQVAVFERDAFVTI